MGLRSIRRQMTSPADGFPRLAVTVFPVSVERAEMSNGSDAMIHDLKRLVGDLAFTDRLADLRASDHWEVYAHPFPSQIGRGFDALISVRRRERDAASRPPLEWRLSLRRGNVDFCPAGGFNQRGQVWFHGLPLTGDSPDLFRARLISALRVRKAIPEIRTGAGAHGGLDATAIVGERLDAATRHDLVGAQGVDAAALVGGKPDTAPPVRRYYLPDTRIFALFERAEDGSAVLTVQTREPECAGAVIGITWGTEFREGTLMATDPPGRWSAECKLRQSFAAAEKFAEESFPSFEVRLPPGSTSTADGGNGTEDASRG